MLGNGGGSARAATALETSTIRLPKTPGICVAPVYAAEAALRRQGFTVLQFVSSETGVSVIEMVTRGGLDLAQATVPTRVLRAGAGPADRLPHRRPFRLPRTLRPRRHRHGERAARQAGAIQSLGAHAQYYLCAMAAHVGLDPEANIDWRVPEGESALELFARGGADR